MPVVSLIEATDRQPPNHGEDLWHRATQALNLGCLNCREYDLCGGLKIDRSAMDCAGLCECASPASCQHVCPRNARHFVARVREVNGFSLHDLPHVTKAECPVLPPIVPEILHGKRRSGWLHAASVAIPLDSLFYPRSGELRWASRDDLEVHFRARSPLLVIDGVAVDRDLENYWSAARRAGFPEAVRGLRPDLVTTPNFSLFTDVPRWDNLHNMKRIAICWRELQAAGSPTALHVNARADKDWERWAEFLREHDEIHWVAFEFRTGAGRAERGRWHVAKLRKLPDLARRALSLVIRGGRQYLADLRKSYRHVTLITADPFMKTIKRRRLARSKVAGCRWEPTLTLVGQPLDDLLQHNVDAYIDMMQEC